MYIDNLTHASREAVSVLLYLGSMTFTLYIGHASPSGHGFHEAYFSHARKISM